MALDVEKYMRRAVALALKAKGRTFPNPLVGAVVVKAGRVVGQGFHRRAGGPHAEICALQQAGSRAAGADLFCTLEPCGHYGRTGPCVEAILKAKIQSVYIGAIDPHSANRGRSVLKLRGAGIRVATGFLASQVRQMNEPFFKAMTSHRPLVTIKIAETLDGRVTAGDGRSKWITSISSRKAAHRLRREFDAIMVGINTVLKDNPGLEPSPGRPRHRLTKVIVDSCLRTPARARLLDTAQPIFIAAVKRHRRREAGLLRRKAKILYTRSYKGRLDLKDLLKKLNTLEIRSLLVEGGPELIGSFLDRRLADRALVFIAPKIIGGRRALSSVAGVGVKRLASAIRLEDVCWEKTDTDFLVTGRLKYV